jgi:hypothetical protein
MLPQSNVRSVTRNETLAASEKTHPPSLAAPPRVVESVMSTVDKADAKMCPPIWPAVFERREEFVTVRRLGVQRAEVSRPKGVLGCLGSVSFMSIPTICDNPPSTDTL